MAEPRHAAHFASLEQQAHAVRLGMWTFLTSELLLFAGLFALYFAYRGLHPGAFVEGVAHNRRLLGSLNTVVLICSSFAVAMGVHAQRAGTRRTALALLAVAGLLGVVFLVVKFVEYRLHFEEGIYPGGRGHFFGAHGAAGLPVFFTLYFIATGLHAAHVIVGLSVLAWAGTRVARAATVEDGERPLSAAAMYWHLVDAIWIFLWPLFYLMHEV